LGQGANTALPIYGYFMKKIYDDKALAFPQNDFKAPEGYEAESLNCDEFSDPANSAIFGEGDGGFMEEGEEIFE
ncbi:MAG: hypothetical protein NWQ53_07210, partial [Flavobacteriales bacterium]|nr:hypothetical protein [Flavobacteriales bacterium]